MQAANYSPEAILRQIDAIMGELQALRHAVQALLQAESPAEHLPATGTESLSAWDIIQAAPGQRQFHTAKDVAHYLREEQSTWDD